MDQLYQITGETEKRRFWQRKKVKTFAESEEHELNDRVHFLTSEAAFSLAQEQVLAFRSISLKLPLHRSMKNKVRAQRSAALLLRSRRWQRTEWRCLRLGQSMKWLTFISLLLLTFLSRVVQANSTL